jgi:hypothetical protein
MESLTTLQLTERGMRKPGTEVPGRRIKSSRVPLGRHSFSCTFFG